MRGICGWVGAFGDDAGSHRILAGMLRDCGADENAKLPGVREPHFHLGCVGSTREIADHLHADESFVAAITEPLQGASGRRLLASDLIDLYRAHRLQFLRRVRGPFALVLYDQRNQRLILARDPSGRRPLYFHRSGSRLAFSSRLDAFRRLPSFRPTFDAQSLFEYVFFRSVPSPHSIYVDCGKLVPGELLIVEGRNAPTRRPFWLPSPSRHSADLERRRSEWETRLSEAMRRTLQDTASVALLPQDALGRAVLEPPLTQILGHPPTVLDFDAEDSADPEGILQSLTALNPLCDEPLGTPTLVTHFLAAQTARKAGIRSLVSDLGLGDLFGNTAQTADQLALARYGRMPPFLRRRVLEPLLFRMPGLHRIPGIPRLQQLARDLYRSPPERHLEALAPRWPGGAVFRDEFLAAIDPESPRRHLDAWGETSPDPDWAIGFQGGLIDLRVAAAQQAAARMGIEMGFPCLDPDVVALSIALSPAIRHRGLLFAKTLIAPRVPVEDVSAGEGRWVQDWLAREGPIRAWFRDQLRALEARDFLNPAYVRWLGQQCHRPEIAGQCWSLGLLEHWLRGRP